MPLPAQVTAQYAQQMQGSNGQSSNGYGQNPSGNMPAGSPLQGGYGQNGQSGNGSSGSDSSGSSSYGNESLSPTIISDDNRNLNNIDRSIQSSLLQPIERLKPAAKPSEFEEYVARVLGRKLKRFGSDLLVPASRDFSTPSTAAIPPDYILNVGDVVGISMTGSIEGSVEREIDSDGKIFLPKVGGINLAGARYADLKDRVSRAIGRQDRKSVV